MQNVISDTRMRQSIAGDTGHVETAGEKPQK